ncbi:NAD dependent epimerase/dehydratase family domain-containing protein [Ditylenchus destructor]|uniref:NAD dependent epimerase/dehydratase family domain-containing protein n=1 Tax=Ditylenchus destructor TaxID=166010 RepID=A0AAD4N9H7_9BILA|nr:NAD dependent epimerase/dehydratase family domain-containing protein [Ditylenchus destructor]
MSSKRLKIFVTGAGGFIGGSIAVGLAKDGHQVSGLIRRPELGAKLERLGIQPVVGTLDDRELLIAQAKQADAVINAASSDHRGAVEALLDGLERSGKTFLHTTGSTIVSDTSGGERGAAKVFHEDALPEPTKDKAARVAIDRLVLEASEKRGIRSAVICPTLIYGHGKVAGSKSVQLPRLVKQAQKSGVVRHVGSGGNIWSNVHIDDVVQLYVLALEKTPAGTFYFAESGEASFHEMSEAVAAALKLGPAQPWPIDEATKEWGYEMTTYALGSNSRVRGKRAREILGWQPKRTSVIDWIKTEMVR